MSRLKHFVSEVHRRSRWQVLLIYVGGAWACYELIDTITSRFELPAWLPGLAAVLFLLGLPFVVATSFVQEGGPLWGQADPTLIPDADQPVRLRAAGAQRLFTWRNAISGVLALAPWGVVATGWYVLAGGAPTESMEERNSIAVLPFENLSPDPEDAYFADGVHDEIISQLSKIADLSVTSRTSVGYRSQLHSNPFEGRQSSTREGKP